MKCNFDYVNGVGVARDVVAMNCSHIHPGNWQLPEKEEVA